MSSSLSVRVKEWIRFIVKMDSSRIGMDISKSVGNNFFPRLRPFAFQVQLGVGCQFRFIHVTTEIKTETNQVAVYSVSEAAVCPGVAKYDLEHRGIFSAKIILSRIDLIFSANCKIIKTFLVTD